MPGDYGLVDGIWMGKPPGMPHHVVDALPADRVKENADGSITVSQPLVLGEGDDEWRGTLQDGIWSRA
jgi:hypothetical protein